MRNFPPADLDAEIRAALDLLRRVQAHPDIPAKFGPILDRTIADTSRVLHDALDASNPPDGLPRLRSRRLRRQVSDCVAREPALEV